MEQLENGILRISGILDFSTVSGLLTQVRSLARGADSDIKVDLSSLERSNSAGLAFLMELVADARKHNRKISFTGIPAQLLDLARMSNVEQILTGE